uniref:G-protein coupled receptors family 1 profile domain-containing protein n=1 Tax=Cyprinus carpio TaxID=7962 RepID=A0A8C2HA15_CYPCA
MNETLDLNITLEDGGNWTFVNGSNEFFLPQNNITYVGYYLHQPSVAAVFIVSYLLIFLVCMVGNGVVCFIVLRSKNMRTVTNLFILNLAISDLLVGIFCMPTTLLDNIITGQCNAKCCLQELQTFICHTHIYRKCHFGSSNLKINCLYFMDHGWKYNA